MNRHFSLYLDGLRAGAAFVVLLSHFAYPRFTETRYAWIRDLNLGSDAVIVFFVLSGLVIACCAAEKEPTFGHFAFARITRLLSVAVPALMIGFGLDWSGSTWFPDFYANQYFNPIGFWDQLLRGLTFSNEWTLFATRLGTNGPYWSLSYEAAYYALFAVFFFLRGAMRGFLLAAMVLLFGINIMLLMPCWLLGVWLYSQLKATAPLPRKAALLLTLLPVVIYAGALMADVPTVLQYLTDRSFSVSQYYNLRFSDQFLWNFGLAILTALHLLGVNALCQGTQAQKTRISSVIRYAASISFSLYLFHYPVLQFLKPLLASFRGFPLPDLVLLSMTLLVCLLFGATFERSLPLQRAAIAKLFAGKRRSELSPASKT